MCKHKLWQLLYDEETGKVEFTCLTENIIIDDDKLIRQKAASILGKMGGAMLKQQRGSDYYSAIGKKGMASRWPKT